ncbi:MAG: hypothetical protein ABR949_05220 [Candidatus Aquilonibacter sp.]
MITPSPAVTAMPPPTQSIVAQAYERLRSYPTPPYVVYLTNENGDVHRIAFRASDEMMNDSEYLHQATLPLTNIYRAFVGPLSITVHEAVVKATPGPNGQPSANTAPMPTPEEESSLVSDLKTIAVVSAHAKPVYNVVDRGVETVDAHQDYHLVLDPALDPSRFALRDLWIDTTTHDVRRADYVTTDPSLPGAVAYLTVNFEPVGPYWIAAHWVAIYHMLGPGQPFYRELKVEKMRFPSTLPDWLWDERAYEAHRRDRELDPLAGLFDGP